MIRRNVWDGPTREGKSGMGQSGERVWRLESERERELLVEGEAWLRDCFSDCPERLTGADVVDGLERLYPGGAAGFRADGCVTP